MWLRTVMRTHVVWSVHVRLQTLLKSHWDSNYMQRCVFSALVFLRVQHSLLCEAACMPSMTRQLSQRPPPPAELRHDALVGLYRWSRGGLASIVSFKVHSTGLSLCISSRQELTAPNPPAADQRHALRALCVLMWKKHSALITRKLSGCAPLMTTEEV